MDAYDSAAALSSIQPEKTAHLCIDVQSDYFSPTSRYLRGACAEEGPQVAERIAKVAPLFNEAGLAQTFWIYHTAVAPQLYLVEPQPADRVMAKKKYSAFIDTPLADELGQLHVDTLLVSGGYTTHCIKDTVAAALDRGFKVFVLTDCIQNYMQLENGLSAIFNDCSKVSAPVLTTSAEVLAHLNKAAAVPAPSPAG